MRICARAHGNAPVILTVTVRKQPEPAVILDIADASPELPVQDLPGEVGHFGLWIAEELAYVTIDPTATGKTVRAEFNPLDRYGKVGGTARCANGFGPRPRRL